MKSQVELKQHVKDKGYCAIRSDKRTKRQNARYPKYMVKWEGNRQTQPDQRKLASRN
jgi:hypothetical protein